MIPILIFGTGGFGGEGLDASLTGGVTHFLGTDLHPLWYLPNGVWRTHQGETEENPLVPPPFSEFEITYCLNPGQRDAKVAMTLQYRNLDHVTLDFTAPAERLLTWNNYEQVPVNILRVGDTDVGFVGRELFRDDEVGVQRTARVEVDLEQHRAFVKLGFEALQLRIGQGAVDPVEPARIL